MQKRIEKALKGIDDKFNGEKRRYKPLPTSKYDVLDEEIFELLNEPDEEKHKEFVTLTVKGSKGETYTVYAPKSYYPHIPKEWQWDAQKYAIAELLAAGYSVSEILRMDGIKIKGRATIYGWLQHPEFAEHVKGLTLEAGFASKRERIASINRILRIIFSKIVQEIDQVKLTANSAAALLNVFATLAKQLAQEKEEFVEHAKIEQDTKVDVSGTLATASLSLEQYLSQLPDDEREEMEKEFAKVADTYIQQLRGDLVSEELLKADSKGKEG